MVHQNPQPLLVPAAGEDYEALALHPYADLHHHHQQQQQIFEPVIYVNKPFWKSASRLKKAKAKAKAESRKNKKSRVERYDLSTTTVALYLLRYNVALQIAATAIVINLLLSVATFACGLNSLYCAFGMDCVIGQNHHLVHPRLALRLRQNRAHQGADRGAGSPLPPQRQQQQQWIILSSSSGSTFSSSTPNGKSTSPSAAASLQDLIEASCRSGLSLSLSLGLTNAADTSNLSVDSINTKEDQNRELWSTFWLGQVMILSGIGVVVRTLIEVISHVSVAVVVTAENEEHFFDKVLPSSQATTTTSMEPLYLLALISLALNLLLMAAKLVVYVFLRSNSMLIEGVNSFISALFASVAAVSIRYSASVAYLDQIVSLLFGIFLITYGGYNMLVTVGETVYQVVMNGGKANSTSKKQYFSSSSSGRGHHHHQQQQYQMLV
ncbi:hypothetical protein TYRP_011493 [Tyrophagus putrescentiae]|nr:hypothetical protein TYRP_011493 [Tyrophagus putrescentiae]